LQLPSVAPRFVCSDNYLDTIIQILVCPGGETDEEAIPENLDPLEDDDLVRCPVTESMIPNLNVHDSELDFIRRAFRGFGPEFNS
jgi:hypothetical protein